MLSFRSLAAATLFFVGALPAIAQNQDRFRIAILNGPQKEGALPPPAEFFIAFGPHTKSGRPEEFAAYKQVFGTATVYAVPGSDLAASPWAKEGFTRTFQRLYRSFDFGDYHFVILDSITRSPFGHFDNAQLKWLEDDLKKMKKSATAILFVDHRIGGGDGEVDNEDALLRVLAAYPVSAIFCAKSGGKIEWRVNGIPCFAIPDSAYVAECSIARIRILSGDKQIASVSREPGPRRRVAFGWDDPNIPLLARRQFLAELRSDKKTVRNEDLSAQYRVDDGPWTPMEPDRRIDPGRRGDNEGRFMARFQTKGLGWGGHRLQVRIKADDGEEFQRSESFAVEELHNAPKREWEFDAGEAVAADLALSGDTVFACTLDGKAFALNADNGKKRWMVATKGAIYAAPVESNGILYVASTDHILYAIDSKSGTVKWRYEAAAPLLDTPIVSGEVVSIVAAGKTITLVDGKPSAGESAPTRTAKPKPMAGDLTVDLSPTGELTWSASPDIKRFRYHLDPGFCLSHPAASSKRTYAASMNGTVYAVSLPQ